MAQDIILSSGEVTSTTIEIIGTQETSAAVAVTVILTDGTDTFSDTLAFSGTTARVTFTGLKPATTYTASFYNTEEGSITVTTLADEPKVATQSQWEDLVSRIKNGGAVPLTITVVPDPDAPGTIIPCTWSGATVAEITNAYTAGRPIKVSGYRGNLDVIGVAEGSQGGTPTTILTALANDIIVHFELLTISTGQILHDVLVDSDDIVDDLNTDDPFSPLSASQGVALKNMVQDLNAPERYYHYVQGSDSASDVVLNVPIDFEEYEKIVIDVEYVPGSGITTPIWVQAPAKVNGTNATCYRSGHVFEGGTYNRQLNYEVATTISMGASSDTATEAHLEIDASASAWPIFYGRSVGGPSSSMYIQDVMGKIHHTADTVSAVQITLKVPRSGAVVEAYGYKRS